MSEDKFIPHKFGATASGLETYGASELEAEIVNHVLPDDWQSGEGHGRKVIHVVSTYLDACELPDDEDRLRHARRTVAADLDVHERTIRRALGERLYDDDVSQYDVRFLQDLREIERLWKKYADDA